ncbi:MAG TPA: 50S ribosomal protein L5 [Hadesarchaea archaeon]|nr:50S ribosomal protein L5 [Hadesarchaea archaeon]
MNPMREIRIEKVVLNIGTGEGGDKLAKAENVLKDIAGQKPMRTFAKKSVREWGVKRGNPLGCMVTLRGERAIETLKRLLDGVERHLKKDSFDNNGNFAFGIKEHIDIPGISYDPELGVFGMDVCVTLARPGYRIKRRRRLARPISTTHLITKEEAINFVTEKFGVQVI